MGYVFRLSPFILINLHDAPIYDALHHLSRSLHHLLLHYTIYLVLHHLRRCLHHLRRCLPHHHLQRRLHADTHTQFRMAWTVDNEGNYRSSFPTPTGIPADPVLTSHGLDQAEQLATHLATLNPPVDIVYSSPYYRCLQTINPYVKAQAAALEAGTLPDAQRDTARIRGEHGVCEWFGAAPFAHPQPADQATLKGLFPLYDDEFLSPVKPRVKGETYVQMVGRVRDAMRALIKRCDDEGRKAVVICSHAAVIIALGRVLTGQYPEEMETDDFKAFTCGLSVYARSEGRGIDGKDDNGEWKQ